MKEITKLWIELVWLVTSLILFVVSIVYAAQGKWLPAIFYVLASIATDR